jgi:glycosyltransferase involved in cell wall biosynthesis
MSAPLISFIIPCHNNEKTLEKAVNSVLNQDFADKFEIIIVENASVDHTYRCARALKEKYKNKYSITLFQSNSGVSNARNCGIQHAKGRYISFVDADDSINQKEFAVLFKDAEMAQSDLYCYGHIAGDEKRSVIDHRQYFPESQVENIKAKMIADPTKYMQAWGKLFRTAIIEENKVRFNSSLSFAEDSDFTLNFLRFSHSICLCSELAYYYTLNPNSAMRVFSGDKTRHYLSALYASKKLIDQESDQIKKAFNRYVLMHFNIIMVREVFSLNNPDTYDNKISAMKSILSDPIIHEAMQKVKFVECCSPKMLPFLLMKMKQYRLASQIYSLRARQNWKRENH